MSYATLILGESGTGKTCSMRNLDPQKTLLIQPVRKPLPFPSKGWKVIHGKNNGNIFVSDDVQKVIKVMQRCPHEIIVIDDYQYFMSFMFMARRSEKSYEKFTDIGGAGFDICKESIALSDEKRVYILAHTQNDDFGNVKIKTLGRMLDEKIVLEGLFTTVLRTNVSDGKYRLSTQNNGSDTVKSPMGMFEDQFIENDIKKIDGRICEYYGIGKNQDDPLIENLEPEEM